MGVAERDWENLSAYIDGDMSPDERRALEARLAHDPALRAALDDLRENVRLLADLPRVKAPRNFTLDPAVYGRPARGFAWWSARFAGALGAAASIALVIGVALMLTVTAAPASVSPPHEVAAQATEAEEGLTQTQPAGLPAATQPPTERATATGARDAAAETEAGSAADAVSAPTGAAERAQGYAAAPSPTEARPMAAEAPDAYSAEMQPLESTARQDAGGGPGEGLAPAPSADLAMPGLGGAGGEEAEMTATMEKAGEEPMPSALASSSPTVTATPPATATAQAAGATLGRGALSMATAAPAATPSPTAASTALPSPAAPANERAPARAGADLGPALVVAGAVMLALAGVLAGASLLSRRR